LWGTAALVAWAAFVLGTAAALRPAPTDESYFSQRAPRLAHLAIFEGDLLEAQIAGVNAPSGPLLNREPFANRLRSGLTVSARIVPAGATPGPAPIVSVFDRRRREVLLLGQEGEDAIFRVRLASRAVGLRVPGVRLRRGISTPGGTDSSAAPISLFGHADGRHLSVAAGPGRSLIAARLSLSPGLGWSLFLPTDVALDHRAQWLSALWLAALVAPAAYWLSLGVGPGRTARRLTAMALIATIALVLAAPPLVFAASAAVMAEWVGAGAGASAAWLLGLTIREAPERPRVRHGPVSM
jgi:hypothetical protein